MLPTGNKLLHQPAPVVHTSEDAIQTDTVNKYTELGKLIALSTWYQEINSVDSIIHDLNDWVQKVKHPRGKIWFSLLYGCLMETYVIVL